MDSAWVFSNSSNDLSEWARNQPANTDVQKLKKLEVKVVMCCNRCVEKVEEAVLGMAGVFDYKTDRWKDRLTIMQTPSGGPNRKKLVKVLKKATHDKDVEILESSSSTQTPNPPNPPTGNTTTTVVYGEPMWPGHLHPWPASVGSPFVNPHYFQHMVSCGNCLRFPGAVCANCGRRGD